MAIIFPIFGQLKDEFHDFDYVMLTKEKLSFVESYLSALMFPIKQDVKLSCQPTRIYFLILIPEENTNGKNFELCF